MQRITTNPITRPYRGGKEETMMTIKETAASMLGVKECPASLSNRLDRVQELCENATGDLVSRQVIATIILQWELDN
jgi:hypothetical protein